MEKNVLEGRGREGGKKVGRRRRKGGQEGWKRGVRERKRVGIMNKGRGEG